MSDPRRSAPLARYLRWMLVFVALVLPIGCVQSSSQVGSPALPVGYGHEILDTPLGGYVFAQTGTSLLTTDTRFIAPDGTRFLVGSGLVAVSLWLSPLGADGFAAVAARFWFVDEGSAVAAHAIITNASHDSLLWTRQDGHTVDLVQGAGAEAVDLQVALANRQFVILESQTTRARFTTRAFPSAPPDRPLAAGYVEFPPQLLSSALDALAAQGWPDLRPVKDLLKQAGVRHVAFALYGEGMPAFLLSGDVESLSRDGVTALFGTETTLPAPLLSWTFNLGAQRLGLSLVKLREGRGYRYQDDGLVTIASTRGGSIFAALASSTTEARVLLDRLGK
ncbi:MAG: hypothetical protein O3B84_01665 [Chloroflexi bacterium]|nr:hypothetical protein [Chloroflexota bacterium]